MDRYGEKDLIRLKQCRIRKQVLTMADIIASDGVHLQQDAHTYVPSLGKPSWYEWAKELPSGRDWTLWQQALSLITSQNGSFPFFDSLGAWILEPHTPSEWLFPHQQESCFKKALKGTFISSLMRRRDE